MKAKKIVTSFALISILTTGTFALGTSVKALETNGIVSTKDTISKNTVTKSVNSITLPVLYPKGSLKPQIDKNSVFRWNIQNNAVEYNFKIYKVLVPNFYEDISDVGYSSSANPVDNLKRTLTQAGEGDYEIRIEAYDSQDKVIAKDFLRFYFDGTYTDGNGLRANMSTDGIFTWNAVASATDYELTFYQQSPATGKYYSIGSANGNAIYRYENIWKKSYSSVNGTYKVTIKAYDANNNLHGQETYEYVNNGGVFTKK